jgi:hypothetical protein
MFDKDLYFEDIEVLLFSLMFSFPLSKLKFASSQVGQVLLRAMDEEDGLPFGDHSVKSINVPDSFTGSNLHIHFFCV